MSGSLPPPRDGTQRYLKAILDRLGDIEGRVGELSDRFPAAPAAADGQVELREPAASPAGGEAAAASGGGPGVKARRPARSPATPRTRTAKKPVKEPAAKPPQGKPAAPKSTNPKD